MRKCFQFGKLAKSFFFFIASPMREYSLLIELWNIFVIKKSLLEYNWLRKLRKIFSDSGTRLNCIRFVDVSYFVQRHLYYQLSNFLSHISVPFNIEKDSYQSSFTHRYPTKFQLNWFSLWIVNSPLLLHSCRFRNHNKNRWHVKISNLTIWIILILTTIHLTHLEWVITRSFHEFGCCCLMSDGHWMMDSNASTFFVLFSLSATN